VALEIVPIDCGAVGGVENSTQQYLTAIGTKIAARVITWLIRGGEKTILVDSGSGTVESVRREYGRELIQTDAQRPEVALAAAGVTAEEIDILIQTHLHWDHCLSLLDDLYPNAEVYLQRVEAQYAAAPYPVHQRLYNHDVVHRIVPGYAADGRLRLLDGDWEVIPGVRVLHTPGHSPGLMATVVETASGRVALAGDNVPLASSWGGGLPGEWVPPGIHVDLRDCYASNRRIALAADLVLPSHDPCVLGQVYR
jgi:glyoxylase-like metal-dependent hydrolase (beta-lactamase superfamily II)